MSVKMNFKDQFVIWNINNNHHEKLHLFSDIYLIFSMLFILIIMIFLLLNSNFIQLSITFLVHTLFLPSFPNIPHL